MGRGIIGSNNNNTTHYGGGGRTSSQLGQAATSRDGGWASWGKQAGYTTTRGGGVTEKVGGRFYSFTARTCHCGPIGVDPRFQSSTLAGTKSPRTYVYKFVVLKVSTNGEEYREGVCTLPFRIFRMFSHFHAFAGIFPHFPPAYLSRIFANPAQKLTP